MSEHSIEITDQNFEGQVMQSDLPIVVDFWAPWCGPCKKVGPVLDELAAEFQGRLRVGKLDVAQHQMKASELGIRSIPALLFYNGGKLVGSLIGAQPKNKIKDKIEEMVG